MNTYKLTQNPNVIQRIEDGAFIPVSIDNKDYREFINSGVTILPGDPVVAPINTPTLADVIAVLPAAAQLQLATNVAAKTNVVKP